MHSASERHFTAIALGVVGEIARREVGGPFYRLAFLAVIVGGAVALVAIRRGERSLVTMLAFVPVAIIVAFGAAQLFG